MPNILTIAYSVEGPTDTRFIGNIIQRTFEEIAFQCDQEIDVYSAVEIRNPKIGGFSDNILKIAELAFNQGIHVLCIHTDSDAATDKEAFKFKINPAFEGVKASEKNVCTNLVAVIPVRMSEAWMLADCQLFKDEISTIESDGKLGIIGKPEKMADPKTVIQDAIRIAQQSKPKKARNIEIGDVYQPLGQNISLDVLETLPSYAKFKASVTEAFRRLNYLH